MKLKEAFKTFPSAGECEVDRPKMEKAFTIMCRILKSYDYENNVTYRLLQYTPKAKRNFSCTISEKDAEWMIGHFNLTEVLTYHRSVAYVPCVIV